MFTWINRFPAPHPLSLNETLARLKDYRGMIDSNIAPLANAA
jgi:hypothetical protein